MTSDVLLVTPHPGTVASSYMQSVLALQAYDREHDHRLSGFALMQCGAGRLPETRNTAVEVMKDQGAEWLWMVDSDMGFQPDTLDRLLACEQPVVGALCHGLRSAGPDGMFGSVAEQFATMYGPGFRPLIMWKKDELVPVYATGAGCLLLHRSVFEKIEGGWFDPLPDTNGGTLGEDLSFFQRTNRAGIQAHVHSGIRTSHYQRFWI